MGATLEALHTLQHVESQIVDIRRQLAAKRSSVKRQSAKVQAAEDALAAGRASFKHDQMAADAADLDLKGRDAIVNRLRDNLNTVRTNKEYAAVLSQLNNEKADRSRLETRVLELMAAVDEQRKTLAAQEESLKAETDRLSNLKDQLKQAESSFAARLATLEQERERAAGQLNAKTLELFNRISERYDGEVLARVVQVHPRRQEYICEGCNMSLAAERANALLTRDEVFTCDNCGRILHMDKGG